MKIGVPKEIKNNENRVGLTPAGVKELVQHGHDLFVQPETDRVLLMMNMFWPVLQYFRQ